MGTETGCKRRSVPAFIELVDSSNEIFSLVFSHLSLRAVIGDEKVSVVTPFCGCLLHSLSVHCSAICARTHNAIALSFNLPYLRSASQKGWFSCVAHRPALAGPVSASTVVLGRFLRNIDFLREELSEGDSVGWPQQRSMAVASSRLFGRMKVRLWLY